MHRGYLPDRLSTHRGACSHTGHRACSAALLTCTVMPQYSESTKAVSYELLLPVPVSLGVTVAILVISRGVSINAPHERKPDEPCTKSDGK